MSERASVKYLKWRNGRPRWEPGPSLRARGVKGRDLKNKDGDWLDADDAREAAKEINRIAESGAGLPLRRKRIAKIVPPYFRTAPPPVPEYRNLLSEVWAENRVRRGGRWTLPTRGSFIYIFTLDDRFAKIGFSTNIRHRFQTLSTSLPVELRTVLVSPGTMEHERVLLSAFAEFRLRGEWFRIAGQFAIWLLGPRQNFRPTSPSDFLCQSVHGEMAESLVSPMGVEPMAL